MVHIESPASAPGGEVVVYEASDGEVRVNVRFDQRDRVAHSAADGGSVLGRDRSVVTTAASI